MGDGLGDPIFVFFVVFMILLFFLLLLKRLYRKPSPMDFQFAGLDPNLRNGRQGPGTVFSVSVHVHEHGPDRPNRLIASNQHAIIDNTPPPSFESVVGTSEGKTGSFSTESHLPPPPPFGHDNLSYVDNEEPPSYQEYLKLHKDSLTAAPGNREETGRF